MMMKNITLIFSAFLLFSCNTSREGKVNSENKITENKGTKMFGKIVIKSIPSKEGQVEMPVLYFDNGIAYFIKHSEGKTTKEELQRNIGKEIDIIGEIKSGSFSFLGEKMRETEMQEGQYVVIYKVLY